MPGNPLSITLPTVGTTVGPTYATQINAAIQALIDDVEANIVTGEITINADLSFASAGTSYGATDLDRAVFTEQGSALAGGNTLSVYAYANELYFQDGAGNNVPITSSGSVAAAAGNISTSGTPAYGDPYHILWVGGDLEYQFLAGSGVYADLVFHEADFRNGANTMVMDSLVTSDYAIHWPAAGPSVNNLMSLDASGNISFTNTVAGAKTFSGAVTCSSTLAVTGAIAYSGDLNFSTNREMLIPAAAMQPTGPATNAELEHSASGAYWLVTSASDVIIPIILPDEGGKIDAWEVNVQQMAAGTITAQLLYYFDGYAVTNSGTAETSTATTQITLSKTSVNLTTSSTIEGPYLLVSSSASTFRVHLARVGHSKA